VEVGDPGEHLAHDVIEEWLGSDTADLGSKELLLAMEPGPNAPGGGGTGAPMEEVVEGEAQRKRIYIAGRRLAGGCDG
jgi:hypothetical protein